MVKSSSAERVFAEVSGDLRFGGPGFKTSIPDPYSVLNACPQA